AVVFPLWSFRSYPRLKARVRAGVPGARLAAYADTMISEWLFVTVAASLWIHEQRDWAWLGLSAPASLHGYLALAAAAAIGALFLAQSAVLARRPETHDKVRGAIGKLVEILPTQRSDLTGFIAVSVTAGICEEVLFRGVLGWYFGEWLGAWGAQAVAVT